jgi:hypothetical protein
MISTGWKTMDDISDLLINKGYARSGRHFSTHYCQRNASYLAMRCGISDTAAMQVVRQLCKERRWLTAARVLHMVLFRPYVHADETQK